MNQIGKIDNYAEAGGSLRQSGFLGNPDPAKIPQIERLVAVSILTTFLRNFPLGNLTEEEKHQFLEFQGYFIGVEADCFDAAGFY
ncbi:MAG: hypothetical protein IKQ67_08020 [Candidatus Methanomethylophilaceae archaeon]|nr:hypothetical protein [Candidatus Methanomethylophilaceae archaeon]